MHCVRALIFGVIMYISVNDRFIWLYKDFVAFKEGTSAFLVIHGDFEELVKFLQDGYMTKLFIVRHLKKSFSGIFRARVIDRQLEKEMKMLSEMFIERCIVEVEDLEAPSLKSLIIATKIALEQNVRIFRQDSEFPRRKKAKLAHPCLSPLRSTARHPHSCC